MCSHRTKIRICLIDTQFGGIRTRQSYDVLWDAIVMLVNMRSMPPLTWLLDSFSSFTLFPGKPTPMHWVHLEADWSPLSFTQQTRVPRCSRGTGQETIIWSWRFTYSLSDFNSNTQISTTCMLRISVKSKTNHVKRKLLTQIISASCCVTGYQTVQ